MLGAAYKGSPDTFPSLYILNSKTIPTAESGISASAPPIKDLIDWPFKGFTINQLSSFLQGGSESAAVVLDHFLVVDQQTSQDGSLLFVEVQFEQQNTITTVRVGSSVANAVPAAVDVGTLDIDTMKTLLDKNNIYRGGKTQ